MQLNWSPLSPFPGTQNGKKILSGIRKYVIITSVLVNGLEVTPSLAFLQRQMDIEIDEPESLPPVSD
jgi:hypothetical protein